MVPITKTKLEEICVLYLNHQPRVRTVEWILLNRPDVGNANWSIDQIEPRLDLHDSRASLKAVRELQAHFRMVV